MENTSEVKLKKKTLTLREFCAVVGCSLQTAYRETKAGRVEVFYIGRTPHVRDTEPERYLDSLPRHPVGRPRTGQASLQAKKASPIAVLTDTTKRRPGRPRKSVQAA